jgi:hypothetical protein
LAHFNLDEIREAASLGNIKYNGRKVDKDIRNLGYTATEVSNCITSLTTKDFHKTEIYADAKFDVYIKDFIRDENKQLSDRIYMKLRLLEDGAIQIVQVGSFHL